MALVRQFVLWNSDKTSSHNFAVNSSIITDVGGLGIAYDIVKSTNGKTVVGYNKNFENITLKINFGVNSDAYARYNDFAAFLAANGNNKFILEYTYNTTTRYADVWVKQLTKTQKTEFGVLEETLVLERVTYWYSLFAGYLPSNMDAISITNALFEEVPVNLKFESLTSAGTIQVSLKQGTTVISTIIITIAAGETVDIYSDDKAVDITLAGIMSNGYNRTNKVYDTFMMVPKGTYNLNITANTNPACDVSYTYKKWVMD